MPVVSPKAICGKCGLLLQGKESTCPSCGVEVDWRMSPVQIVSDSAQAKSGKKSGGKPKEAESTFDSGKWFMAAVGLVAVGVII